MLSPAPTVRPVLARRPARRWRRLVLAPLFSLAALALGLFVADHVIGWLDPYGAPRQAYNGRLYQERLVQVDASSPRLFRHRPNARVPMRGFLFRTDSHGLRGPELATPKPAGTKRLLFVGDSVVLGWGVPEEATFVDRVGVELSARTGRTWETVNAGHLLYDTTQELGALEEVGFAYGPDLVVLVFVENDVVPTRQVYEVQQREASDPGSISPAARALMARVQLIDRLKPWLPEIGSVLSHVVVQHDVLARQGSAANAESVGISLEDGWKLSQQALRRMKELTDAHGVPFAVLDYDRDNEIARRVSAFCHDEGIPYASIGFTPQDYAGHITNSAADAHANPRGHAILTRNVLAALDELHLVDGL